MAVQYDHSVIQDFAARLYSKANSVIAKHVVLGVILLGFAGLATEKPVFGLVGAVVGGILGYLIGKERAFAYKLQAQTALCQAQIETNTRVAE